MKAPGSFSQLGAVLVVTLILLLVITTLAISGMRDSTLEIRVMAKDLEHRRLFNAAEAGLREAERAIAQAARPLAPCGASPCVQGLATNTALDFSTATLYPSSAQLNAEVRWYIRQIPLNTRQPNDASYGAAAREGGTYFYEVSSQAYTLSADPLPRQSQCSDGAVCLRSVMTRTFLD